MISYQALVLAIFLSEAETGYFENKRSFCGHVHRACGDSFLDIHADSSSEPRDTQYTAMLLNKQLCYLR
jgi:hypothetical protein